MHTSKMKLSTKNSQQPKTADYPAKTLHPRCLHGSKYNRETVVKEYDVT